MNKQIGDTFIKYMLVLSIFSLKTDKTYVFYKYSMKLLMNFNKTKFLGKNLLTKSTFLSIL